jgi:hypothetical protein
MLADVVEYYDANFQRLEAPLLPGWRRYVAHTRGVPPNPVLAFANLLSGAPARTQSRRTPHLPGFNPHGFGSIATASSSESERVPIHTNPLYGNDLYSRPENS